MTAPAGKLVADGLGMTFPGRRGDPGGAVTALDGVHLSVGDAEFVSLVGPSGCGKSTLFSILAGLLTPTRGRVLLDGAEHRSLLGRVGFMPQRDLLMPWRSVLDNVIVGLEGTGVRRREARRRAVADFPRFGLSGFEERWPGEISGGMRQRAALLRTFLAGREVLLLDEPFGALDALTRQGMQAWLLEVWDADRKTILFVTHDVEEAVLLSDRVYVMSGRPGRIELCLDVDLPRPRGLDTLAEPRFLELKRRLLEPLREAVLAQAGLV
jgi:ABC-type nitrate/sulfonate/bicarbonate transport system ATPase subunit